MPNIRSSSGHSAHPFRSKMYIANATVTGIISIPVKIAKKQQNDNNRERDLLSCEVT